MAVETLESPGSASMPRLQHTFQNRTWAAPATSRTLVVESAADAATGITNGPTVHILDTCGLTDTVMALQTFMPVPDVACLWTRIRP